MTFLLTVLLSGCREEVTIFLPEHVAVAQPEFTDIEGFYLLCEGNMGWNKATLDYYDYGYGEYVRNIFSYANPTVPKEMGDVGNDIGIYGSNLYCVINCSNKIGPVHLQEEIPNQYPQLSLYPLLWRLCLCDQLCRSSADQPELRATRLCRQD